MEAQLQLLRLLTTAAPGWGVWKGADAVPVPDGDIDSLARDRDWPAVESTFVAWASEGSFDRVAVCRHLPGTLILAALGGHDARRLLQLDVVAHKQLHGALLFRAADIEPLLVLDEERGFRRLRRGAEGLLRVALDKGDSAARRLIESDREGAERAADLSGGLGRAALAYADDGSRARFVHRAAHVSPRLVGEGLSFDLNWRWRCPLLRALRAERRAPADLREWLARVERSHVVHVLR